MEPRAPPRLALKALFRGCLENLFVRSMSGFATKIDASRENDMKKTLIMAATAMLIGSSGISFAGSTK